MSVGCAGWIGSSSSESGVIDDSTEAVSPLVKVGGVAPLAELTSPPGCCTHGVNEKTLFWGVKGESGISPANK